MRRIQERALQNRSRLAGLLRACFCVLLLSACANQGIWPTEPLPAAPAGPLPNAPSFSAPAATPDQPDVLTNVEREELEQRLTKIAKDRETGVQRRIQKGK